MLLKRLDLELSKISLNPVDVVSKGLYAAAWKLQIVFLKSKGRRVCKQVSWRLYKSHL
jgi:hypothetical protein